MHSDKGGTVADRCQALPTVANGPLRLATVAGNGAGLQHKGAALMALPLVL